VAWWALAFVGATGLALLNWLQFRNEMPPSVKADYRLAGLAAYWLLWVPVVAVLSGPVRRLVSARARPAVLVGALVAGFAGVMIYMSAGQALISRFTGPPSLRKLPLGALSS
jgi:hypothetical protein